MALLLLLLGGLGPDTYSDTFPSLIEQLDPADWQSPTIRLRVHGKTTNVLKPLKARLYNVTAAAAVAGSGVTIAGTTDDSWADSAAFALAAGPNDYKVQHGGQAGETYTAYKADLLVDLA